ncbi:MAG: carboxypeptidase-like regulatory domain-containing protein [Acidobacteriia bacterium]|nr:carboxypeptidase-like regulatory domain-containing protein [Terriglobia bacterium]
MYRFLLVILLACVAAFGQGDRGTITGTITDPAGAVVAGAGIEAKNIETGVPFQAASTETGNFTIPQLPVGVYELSVTVPGFKKYVRSGLTVAATQTIRVDIPLEVGAATDSVTVQADATLLKTESGEISHTIQAQHLVDLGLLGIGGTFSSSQGLRFYQAEIALIPGASAPASGFVLGVRVNGAPNGTGRTQIDGMDGTNQINAVQAGVGASVDAIQESAIQTNNFSPEYGSVGGGLFNLTMRSGTNQYHGAGYDYLSNEAFNASTPFVNTRQRIRRNDYGFNVGGPVRIPKVYNGKDKTFFFYNREQYREFFVVNDTFITVPTAAYRTGDFSGAITGANLGKDPLGNTILEGMIYDPASVQNVNGQLVRTQFSNNAIPAARFDKVAVAIQNLIPNPTNGNNSLNNLPSFPNDRVTTNESVKLDHQLNSRMKISGLFLTNATATQYSQSLNGSEGLPATITATRGSFSRSQQWRLNFDDTLSPTVLLHVGAGLLNYLLDDHSPTTNFNDSAIGLTGVSNPGGRFPSLSGLCSAGLGTNTSPCTGTGGTMSMGPGVGAAQSITKQMTPTYQASVTWVKDNHTFKFGSEVREFGYPLLALAATNGSFVFSANQTAQPYAQSAIIGGRSVGFPYASFLLGLVNSGMVNPPADLRMGKHFISFFAQDSWKVTRKLTFNYGLRYDYDTYPREQYGRMPTLAPGLANPTVGGRPGGVIYESTCNCSFAHNYPYAFGPRLGVAYQITAKTVFRAGIGIAYDGTATAATGTGSASPANNFTAPGFGDPAMTLAGGVPQQYVLPWPNLSAGAYPNPNFPAAQNGPTSVVDQNAGRPARQVQWSVGVQREIFPNLLLDVNYVGNRGAWWLSTVLDNYNAITTQILSANGLDINTAADRAILRSTIGSAGAGRFQNKLPYAGFPLGSTVAQSLRPFPQFTAGLAPLWAPQGRTWYDSLQLKVTKRFSHGLILDYAFTYAKEEQLGVEGGTVNDFQNRMQNKTLSGFSRPFVSVVSANYRLPAWGPNKVFSQVVRDWTIGSVLSYASGLPILAPTSTNNLSTLLFRSTYFNRNPGVSPFLKDLNCHCVDPTKDLVLNPAAWSNPTDGQWGTAAPYYNDYRYERRPSESLSLGRIFKFNESGMALTVRMNFQNIFNRTQLSNPTATNPLASTTCTAGAGAVCANPATAGKYTGGFGFINYVGGSTFQPPRQGTLEMRFQF